MACYYVIATAEASSNLARFDGVRYTARAASASERCAEMYRVTRNEGFGAECKRRIMLGTYVLSAGYYDAYYLKAQKVRALVARDYAQALEQVDAIVGPVSPFPAFKLGELVDDPVAMYLSDIYTITGDLAGHPVHERSLWKNRAKACRWDCRFSRAISTRRKCSAWLTAYERAADIVELNEEKPRCPLLYPLCPTLPMHWSRISTR